MRRRDLGSDLTASGDQALVSGEESLRAWVLRLLQTPTGSLLHRPDWGVDAEDLVDAPTLSARSQLAHAIRRQVRRDRRVADCFVSVGVAASDPRRLEAELRILTVDGTTVGFSTLIAV